MRYLIILFCIVLASCGMGQGAPGASPASEHATAKRLTGFQPDISGTGALTRNECTRLVNRSLYNLLFSKKSKPHPPLQKKMVDSCMAGRGHFNREFYNCVFAAKYINVIKCAYLARGIDLAKRKPALARLRPGEMGHVEQQVKLMDAVDYAGQDPRTTISHFDVDRYLDERDNVYRSLGLTPPMDRDVPRHKSTSRTQSNGQTYWIVREDFIETQLVKIRHEDAKGSKTVLCVLYGSSKRLRIDQGNCAAMVRKNFNTTLADPVAR